MLDLLNPQSTCLHYDNLNELQATDLRNPIPSIFPFHPSSPPPALSRSHTLHQKERKEITPSDQRQ